MMLLTLNNYVSTKHSGMHTYTFTHTHGILSVSFMHRFTCFACSKNTTWEYHQHPVKSVYCQIFLIAVTLLGGVCLFYITRNLFFKPYMVHNEGWKCKHRYKPHAHAHTGCIPNSILLLFTCSMYCSCLLKVLIVACSVHTSGTYYSAITGRLELQL